MRFKGVLFDLDGTLIHTTQLYAEACIKVLKEAGYNFTQADFDRLYPQGAVFREWIKELGGGEDVFPAIRAARDTAYIDLLREKAEFLEGAEELLGAVSSHPSAIVTGSWRSYVDAIDEKLGISKHIPLIITADETEPYHKPHPHGLFLAADALEIDPEECIYVGDQLFDISAAKSAGMTACFIRGPHSPKGIEEKADVVAQDLPDLLSILQ